jgi:hypothetical protein
MDPPNLPIQHTAMGLRMDLPNLPIHHTVMGLRMLPPHRSSPRRKGIRCIHRHGSLLPWHSPHRAPHHPLHRPASLSGSHAPSATTRSDILRQDHIVCDAFTYVDESVDSSCAPPFLICADGPVLEPMLIKAVGAKLQINPLLLPVGDDEERPHIRWNMLFSTAHCHRSTDPSHRSWSNGRQEPVTFPRVTQLSLISHVVPWNLTVRATTPSIGVTCGDVIEQLSDHLQRRLRKEDYDSASGVKRRAIRDAYHHNRSRSAGVPGGQLGDGLKALDWLGTQTMYGGIQVNEQYVLERFNVVMPCMLELLCVERPLVDDEAEEPRRARRRSQNMSTSRPPSRAEG